jgi:hypothetical protein
VNALGVIQQLVDQHGLDDAAFTLISHGGPVAPPERRPPEARVPGRRLRQLGLGDLDDYRVADDHVVSIASRFSRPGRHGHLALMDLHLDELVPGEFLAEAARMQCTGRPHWLLRSGRRHHLYGAFLLDEDDWRDWNRRSLTPLLLADLRYISRSEAWGYNLLRLGAGASQAIVPHTADETPNQPRRPIATAAVRLALGRHTWQDVAHGKPVVEHLSAVAALAVHIWTRFRERGLLSDTDGSLEELYACGYLHACLEETGTDYDDVARVVSATVADWVAELSRDKRLPESRRHEEHEHQLGRASPAARVVKLADLLVELRTLADRDIVHRTLGHPHHVRRQLDQLGGGLGPCPELVEAHHLLERWL